jgi:hypothetical protein
MCRDPPVGRHRHEFEQVRDACERPAERELLEQRRDGAAAAVSPAVAYQMPGLEAGISKVGEGTITLGARDLDGLQPFSVVPPEDPRERPPAEAAIGVEIESGDVRPAQASSLAVARSAPYFGNSNVSIGLGSPTR